MTQTLQDRLLAVYAGEHRDHLAALRMTLDRGAVADLEEAYRHAHSLKGAARAVDLPAVVELAHGLETQLEEWWQGKAMPDEDSLHRARRAVDAIEDLSAAALRDGAGAAPEAAPALASTLRVETASVDRLAACSTRLATELDRLRVTAAAARLRGRAAADVLVELLDELEEREWALSRLAKRLADDVAGLRMVAAEEVLGGFGPMLRALAAEQGKDVQFRAEGLETRADRDVLAVMGEAVMHLLRNAVAHGIETPERRRAAGKAVAGRVMLSAAVDRGRLEVQVSDDGAGLAMDRLVREAAARGLLDADQAAAVEAGDVARLAFLPGLSTAGTLDVTAGRGMGMAIVQRLVERLQGRVELSSQPGKGTRVTLSAPITIQAQRVLLVEARGQTFALPVPPTHRLTLLDGPQLVRGAAGMTAVVDGVEYAVLDLGGVLGLPGAPQAPHGLCAALARTAVRAVALVVDRMVDVRDLPITPLDTMMAADDRFAGTVTLERERLALVLSPVALAARQGTEAPWAPAPVPLRRVLVVDDSPTIRALERDLLEGAGFAVEVAVDGRDALDRLYRAASDGMVPDAVVSDIEMPGLDGFALLGAMRADRRLAEVPVVLVSSRAGGAERFRAQELGAAALLGKTGFDQSAFLSLLRELTS